MKKILLVIIATFTLLIGKSQHTFADLFNTEVKVNYLGMDFTQARFVGIEGFTNPMMMQNKYIPSINGLIFSEPEKYSMRLPLRLTTARYNPTVDYITKINSEAMIADHITMDGTFKLSEEDIQKQISSYEIDEEGLGFVMMVEKLNKLQEIAHVHLVFFDMKSKEVVYSEKVMATPMGFGWRNYWARAFYNITQDIQMKYYAKWRSQITN